MIRSQKFRNKITGEINTVIPLLEIGNWEKVDDFGNVLPPLRKVRKRKYDPNSFADRIQKNIDKINMRY